MIQVTIYKDQNKIKGFQCKGHAMYDQYGRDIICAAVSALTINCINSVTTFTKDPVAVEAKEETGFLSFRFKEEPSSQSQLLLESMVLGLQQTQETYGNEYIAVIFKEV